MTTGKYSNLNNSAVDTAVGMLLPVLTIYGSQFFHCELLPVGSLFSTLVVLLPIHCRHTSRQSPSSQTVLVSLLSSSHLHVKFIMIPTLFLAAVQHISLSERLSIYGNAISICMLMTRLKCVIPFRPGVSEPRKLVSGPEAGCDPRKVHEGMRGGRVGKMCGAKCCTYVAC